MVNPASRYAIGIDGVADASLTHYISPGFLEVKSLTMAVLQKTVFLSSLIYIVAYHPRQSCTLGDLWNSYSFPHNICSGRG